MSAPEKSAAHLRHEIERLKDLLTPEARMIFEDLLFTGDCFFHIPSGHMLPSATIVVDSDHYEQRFAGHPPIVIPFEEILHLKKVA